MCKSTYLENHIIILLTSEFEFLGLRDVVAEEEEVEAMVDTSTSETNQDSRGREDAAVDTDSTETWTATRTTMPRIQPTNTRQRATFPFMQENVVAAGEKGKRRRRGLIT